MAPVRYEGCFRPWVAEMPKPKDRRNENIDIPFRLYQFEQSIAAFLWEATSRHRIRGTKLSENSYTQFPSFRISRNAKSECSIEDLAGSTLLQADEDRNRAVIDLLGFNQSKLYQFGCRSGIYGSS